MNDKKKRGLFVFCCVAPALLLYIVFMIIPTINVFRMSLYKWGGYSAEKTFVGLDNFVTLFNDKKFFQSMQNSVLLIVLVTVFTLVFALFFAAVLTKETIKGQNFFRVIFYIPNILSVVVIAAVFSAIYDPNNGLLNSILALFKPGREPTYWLGNQRINIFSIVFAMIWQAIGYYMVMYMASMANIPIDLYESADLDGAGRFTQFFQITLPLIWNNIRTTLSFFIISTINMSFLFVDSMTGGGPDGSTEVLLSYMYKQAYTNSAYGYGMAIGVAVFAFSFALSGLLSAATKREELQY